MSEQCVGPEFTVDDANTLKARLAGAPATAALPSTGNGARVDPDKGLWVPAEHHTIQIAASKTDSPGNKVINPGSQRLGGKLLETIVNPSATRPMLCLVVVTFDAVFDIAPTVVSGWALLGGLDLGLVATDPVAMNDLIVRRDQGVGVESGLRHQVTWTTHVPLDPGETVLLRAQMGLRSIETGYVRYVHTYLKAHGIGVTQ